MAAGVGVSGAGGGVPGVGERWRFVPHAVQGEVAQVKDGRVWVETGPMVWQIRPLEAADGAWVRLPDDHEDDELDAPTYAQLAVALSRLNDTAHELREQRDEARRDLGRAQRGAASTEHMHQLAMRYLAEAGVDTSRGWLAALAALCTELRAAVTLDVRTLSGPTGVVVEPDELAAMPNRVTAATCMRPSYDAGRPLIELRESGLLWWINRVAFHPRGFALALAVDEVGAVVGWALEGDGGELWSFSTPLDDQGFERAQATFAAARVAQP